MPDHRKPENKVQEDFLKINVKLIKAGYTINTLRKASTEKSCASPNTLQYVFFIIAILIPALYMLHNNGMFDPTIKYLLGVRCIVPNNYFVWEATRPLSDCNFCVNVSKVQILPNLTREHFSQFAYSSKPMVIKGAFSNWPAIKVFSFDFFKKLYETFEDSYRSVDEECQFLHFQSDFVSLRDVFAMDYRRIKNLPGQKPWYVGW